MPTNPQFDFETIGARLRRRRQQFGMSTEAVAERAGVARYTVIRVEQGKPCNRATLTKLMRALRMWMDQMVQPRDTEGPFSIHRKRYSRWCVSVPKREYQRNNPDDDPTHVDDEAERRRLGEIGFQPFYTAVMDTSNFGQGMEQAFMELHQPSWVDQHYGEEFVYCVRGSVTLTVDNKPCTLEEGDAMSFDASLPHQYAPGAPLASGDLPPRILIVVTVRPQDKIGILHPREKGPK